GARVRESYKEAVTRATARAIHGMAKRLATARPGNRTGRGHSSDKSHTGFATYMGWAHGLADGQKTMGVMALACYVATKNGDLKALPGWLSFLSTPEFEIKTWVKCACAAALALGTYIGGWRIIRTLGRKLVHLKPVHGFAAEVTAATLLLTTGKLGMPISTTHSISTAIMGVGSARRFSALNWTLVERIVWTWIFTIPATAGMAYSILV